MKRLLSIAMLILLLSGIESNALLAQDLASNQTVKAEEAAPLSYGSSHTALRHDFYQPAPPALASHFSFVYAPNQILRAGVVDLEKSTITLPLYQGRMKDGRAVWYVLTDASDQGIAEELGLNYSPKLRNVGGKAVRTATLETDGTLTFDRGTVDFSPERKVVPGTAPNFFPPREAQAGSKGDAYYTPVVRVGDIVYNATVVAFDVDAGDIEFANGGIDYSKVIDRAVAISPMNGTVTLSLNLGSMNGRPMLFMSLDSNDNLVSALEATTFAPALSDIPVGLNDNPNSAVAANYIMLNGPLGDDNPQKQGVSSALSDKTGQVLDIFDSAPGLAPGYSPMWDLYLAEWTKEAINKGYQSAVYSELQFLGLVKGGWITGPGGGTMGPSGLISNCPLVMSF